MSCLSSGDAGPALAGRGCVGILYEGACESMPSKVVPQVICLSLEDIQGQVFLFHVGTFSSKERFH